MLLKGSAIPPFVGFWQWEFVCDVDIVYPDGYVKSERVSLGAETIDPAVTRYKDVSFPVSFTSLTTFGSFARVNLVEDTFYALHPPFTTLDLYEVIPINNEQLTTVQITGLTGGIVEEDEHNLLSDAFTEYDFIKGGFSQDREDMLDTRIGKWGYFWDDDFDGSFYYSRLLSIGNKNDYRYESLNTCFKNFSLLPPIS